MRALQTALRQLLAALRHPQIDPLLILPLILQQLLLQQLLLWRRRMVVVVVIRAEMGDDAAAETARLILGMLFRKLLVAL